MLHIIQNDAEVPPDNITENLDFLGIPYLIHHPYSGNPLPDLRDVTALIVLGGSMGANDDQSHPFLKDLKSFIRKVVEHQKPYLGICLGDQLLAAACGGSVTSKRWEELGTLAVTLTNEGKHDKLFAGIDSEFKTFQWYHDSFDIPQGATLLAGSSACPHQAFRIGGCAWGTQFHHEVTESIIRDWCAWDPHMKEHSDELVNECQTVAEYVKTAQQLLKNFSKVA